MLASFGAVAAACVLVALRLRPDIGVLTGCLFSGAVAVLAGASVLVRARTRPGTARRALLLIGAAMVLWGIGQVLVGVAVAGGQASFPTIGDGVSTAAAPAAIAGLLLAMEGGSRYAGSARFALDALLLGSSLALVVWRAGFGGVLFVHGPALPDVAAAAMLLLEVTIMSLLLLIYLRDLDRGLLLVLVGMTLYCSADLITVHTVAQPGGQWPPVAAALWCLAWPLVGVGLLGYAPVVRRDDDWYESETRVTMATVLLSIAALCVFLVLVLRSPQMDRGSMAIGLLVVVVFGVRETVSGRQRRRLLATLTQHAVHDPLTDLMNRRGLLPCLKEVERAGQASLLTLDLDGFKEVNDILGHARGDELLVAVSRRIENCLPTGGQAFRIGGDEFAVVVPGPSTDVHDVAERLLAAVRQASVDVPGAAAVGVTASVGVARVGAGPDDDAQDDGSDPLHLRELAGGPSDVFSVLVESSAALRAAKGNGRDRVEYYEGRVAAAHRRALLVERRLHDAVRKGDVAVHYQPLIDLATGRVAGVEALARWTDPLAGRVGPDEFIPSAEQSGLIRPLGSAVLRRAVNDIAAAQARLPGLTVAVNASAVQVRQPDFADEVLDVLGAAGMRPELMGIEVTESVFVDADDPALVQLARLRDHGVHVAIDDFGSGFSALAYLSRLPASVLKIDQALTRQVVEDPRSLAVLQAVVSLAHTMPMAVVVEGIETPVVEDLVRTTGAGYGQGWLWAAAVPIDQLCSTVETVQGRLLGPAAVTAG